MRRGRAPKADGLSTQQVKYGPNGWTTVAAMVSATMRGLTLGSSQFA